MIEQLFSVPVVTGTIVPTDEQLSKSLSFLDEAWAVANRGVWANETGKSTGELKQGMELYQSPIFDWLTMPMLDAVHDYWDNILNYRKDFHMYVDAMWANQHFEGDSTGEHSHTAGAGKSHVSCVYYLKKNPDYGHLLFRDPIESIWGLSPLDYMFTNNKKHHIHKAKSYDYVIFPSWLYHETQPNGKDERIAISINFSGFPLDPSEGDYGSS